jgi:hypothetical protein
MKGPQLAAAASALENLLHQRGRAHLKVTARGNHLIISSDEAGEPEPRLRLTALPGGRYGVSFRHHTGKWDPAPVSGSMREVVDAVEADFGFHLDPWPASGTDS